MNIIDTAIPGVLIIEPKIFGDARGFFLETFQTERYASHGIAGPFVQDNLSRSARGRCAACISRIQNRRASS
jgi:dTDP-4-dehydrorhamnose 3,5-epimerase